ncbi:MAG: extracellular solute-binding protein [Lachnospiraceae bacterium]|nr:extracellular solute-binding protein [Lachnospiraceae bacterium]
MTFRTRLLSALLVLALGAGIFACSGLQIRGEEAAQDVRGTRYARQDSIVFWYTDEALTNYISHAAVDFGELNDIHVIPVLKDREKYLDAVYEASLDAAQMPDVYLVSHEMLEKAYLSGIAAPLSDPRQILDTAHFSTAALHAVTYQGVKTGYPFSFDTSALLCNMDGLALWASQKAHYDATHPLVPAVDEEGNAILDEDGEQAMVEDEIPEDQMDPALLEELTAQYAADPIPKSLEDLLLIADSFDPPEGFEGVMNWDVSDILYNYWVLGGAINVGGETGDNRAQVVIDSEEARSCLQSYQGLREFFSIDAGEVSYASSLQDFLEGKYLFTVGGTDAVEILKEAREAGEVTFSYAVAPMPSVSGGLGGRPLSVTTAVAVNGFSEKKDLAERFAAFLTDGMSEVLYEMAGVPAADLRQEAAGGDLAVFASNYAGSVPLPKMMETENLWMQLEVVFSEVWEGRDVGEELGELDAYVRTLLGEG